MQLLGYFTDATPNWRTRAIRRLEEETLKRGADVGSYIDKRVGRARLWTFEYRKWHYIRSAYRKTAR